MTEQLQTLTVAAIRDRAREDAKAVLREYWPDAALPVDPVTIARALGLSVFSAELGEDVWGMLVGGQGGADIYLDRDQPPTRFRFSCAHEMGHFVLRADEITSEDAFIDKRSDAGMGTADEIYANEFAGSLLMPEEQLRDAIKAGADNFSLTRRFNVSLAALQYRRHVLGI